MIVNSKILSQTAIPATSLTTVYTVPADFDAIVTGIHITNRSAVDTTFRLAIQPLGAAISNEHYLYYDLPLTGNDTFLISSVLMLSTTDVISLYVNDATVSCTIFGQEYNPPV